MADAAQPPQIYLARHGETAWSLSGQHTGTTDIPLTPNGEAQARALGGRIAGIEFDRVLSSPRARAIRTADLAGLAGRIEVAPELAEWDYGAYEGLTSDQIQAKDPGWLIYRDGCPGGESVAAIAARADRFLARFRQLPGTTILFSHGHMTRILAIRWLGLPVIHGQHFKVDTAALGTLSFGSDRATPVIALWNDRRHTQD